MGGSESPGLRSCTQGVIPSSGQLMAAKGLEKTSWSALLFSFISAQCTGVAFSAEIRKYFILLVHSSPSFPVIYFPLLFSSEGLRVLCAHHCSGLCQEVVSPPRGYCLSPASRAIRPFPCAKGREESQRTGNKWSLLSQGTAGVQGPSLDPAWEGMGGSDCQGTFKVRINNFCLTQQRSWSWQREKSRSEWHGNGAGRTLHKEQGEGSFTSQPGHSRPCKWGL